jgi:putative (di)nucleoside polyphosphate hydrolase
VIDNEGFRLGVGMIVTNKAGEVLWARRIKQNAWQFPQGGLQADETPEDALYRELHEEVGLTQEHVACIGSTKSWLAYQLPERLLRHNMHPLCIGQKQKWFLLKLIGGEENVHLDLTHSPEFDRWRWVNYWYPLKQVISFKRHVYRRALEELSLYLPATGQRSRYRTPRIESIESV